MGKVRGRALAIVGVLPSQFAGHRSRAR
ncbi:MAG: hypothetical protein JWR58_1731, partial [Pseudonocardia sp.]|nr:hypothetical protein [Pseudonocardia sp.]